MASRPALPELITVGREALRIGELIACGGQASVERAQLGAQELYLKRPLPHLPQSERLRALSAEERALVALDEGVAPSERRLIGLMSSEGGSREGLLLRPIRGATLAQLSRHGPPWRPGEVAQLCCALLDATAAAWAVGLWGHGDLSAANALLDERGSLWLLDWSAHQREGLWQEDQARLASLLFFLTTGQRATQVERYGHPSDLERAGWPTTWATLLAKLSGASLSQTEAQAALESLWGGASELEESPSLASLKSSTRARLLRRVSEWCAVKESEAPRP